MRSSAPGCSRTCPRSCCPRRPGGSSTTARTRTLVSGLHQLRREVFDTLDYDTVVVLDSHWATTVEFVVTAQDRRAGLFTSEELPRGMCQRPYDFAGRPRARAPDRRARATSTAPGSPRSTTTTCRSSTRPPTSGSSSATGLPDKRWISHRRLPDRRHRGQPAARPGPRRRDRRVRPQGPADRLRARCRTPSGRCASCATTRPRAGSTSSPRRRRRRPRAARVVPQRRPRAGARHDAGVLPLPARGPVRPLPDDDRRPRRGRLHRDRAASTASTRTRSAPARCTSGSTGRRTASPGRDVRRPTPTSSARTPAPTCPPPADRFTTKETHDPARDPPHPARRQRRRRRPPRRDPRRR